VKVIIRSIRQASEYKDGVNTDLEGLRDVDTRVVGAFAHDMKFRLPAVEVDGGVVVGGVYELVFARRES